jgi:hypothetical protein
MTRSATADELVSGTGWYVEAHALAAEIDPHDPVRGAAVLAVLSPRRNWAQNVTLARYAYATAAELIASGVSDDVWAGTWDAFPTTGDQRRKLSRLFRGEDPDAVVGGPKVRSFWQTIADPHSGGPAVIDRHAMAVAQGRTMSDEELKINKAQYAAYVHAYAIASAIIGQAPAIVQAVTWVAWRRNNAHAQGQHAARLDAAA